MVLGFLLPRAPDDVVLPLLLALVPTLGLVVLTLVFLVLLLVLSEEAEVLFSVRVVRVVGGGDKGWVVLVG